MSNSFGIFVLSNEIIIGRFISVNFNFPLLFIILSKIVSLRTYDSILASFNIGILEKSRIYVTFH